MLGDDHLEAGRVLLRELEQQLEQPANRLQVGVGLRFLDRAIGFLVDLLGREIDLGRLVDQQEPRDRAVVLDREQMQGKQRREVVGQMVLAAAGSAHGNRAFGSIEDDCDVGQIEPRRVSPELRLELLDVLRYLRRDNVQYRVQPFVAVVRADALLQILDLLLEAAVLALKPGKFLVRERGFPGTG